MSELRELFEIWATRKHVSQATHALLEKIVKELEALVEAVEPEECPQGCDATIRKLRTRLERLHNQLTEADATILRLGEQLAQERDEVKAKISDMAVRLAMCRTEADEWHRLLIVQTETRVADATIGGLVREMPDGTALQHTGAQYYAMRSCLGGGWHPIMTSCATDPAEALRSIQGGDNDPRV